MADSQSHSGSTGIVAIFAILLLIVIATFVGWRTGVFGADTAPKAADINLHTPGLR